MRADPGSARRDISQHRVEYRPCLPFVDWVDPDEHSIDRQELFAYLIGDIVGIDRRLGVNAKRRQLFEDAVIAIILGFAVRRASRSPRQGIAILLCFTLAMSFPWR